MNIKCLAHVEYKVPHYNSISSLHAILHNCFMTLLFSVTTNLPVNLMVSPSSSLSDLSLVFDLKPLSQHSIFLFSKRCSLFFSTFMNSSSFFLQCLFVFPALIRFCFATTTLLIHESKGEQIGIGSANLSWARPRFWVSWDKQGLSLHGFLSSRRSAWVFSW